MEIPLSREQKELAYYLKSTKGWRSYTIWQNAHGELAIEDAEGLPRGLTPTEINQLITGLEKIKR